MGVVVVRSQGPRGLKQDVLAGTHRIVSDEPRGVGGTDAGPSPYELLLASLGSCTAMTLELYARRKGWPLARVTVRLRHDRIHEKDCTECDRPGNEPFLERIEREVALDGPLDAHQRAQLIELASRCPVHRTLSGNLDIATREIRDLEDGTQLRRAA
jgi:putative redox protein